LVSEALSKRIHGVIGLMRTKYESWIVVVAVSMLLIGCANKPKNQLEALDRFWDALGGKTKDLVTKTE
jgi:hypothetical protein